jgi:hypothetical protein
MASRYEHEYSHDNIYGPGVPRSRDKPIRWSRPHPSCWRNQHKRNAPWGIGQLDVLKIRWASAQLAVLASHSTANRSAILLRRLVVARLTVLHWISPCRVPRDQLEDLERVEGGKLTRRDLVVYSAFVGHLAPSTLTFPSLAAIPVIAKRAG